MKKLFPVISGLLFCSTISAQHKKSIEMALIGRFDTHGNSISNFAGRSYNDTTQTSGFSYGASVLLRHKIFRSYSISVGVGYYQLRIDKIKGNMPFNMPGTRTGRNIDYDDIITNMLYSTSQYFYNNLAFTLALDKEVLLKRKIKLNIATEFVGYKSISQKYRLNNSSNFYKTTNDKTFEFGVNVNAGILKEFKRFYLRPSLIVPIYQNLKGDKVFYEDTEMNISNWFSGIGLTVKIGKYF